MCLLLKNSHTSSASESFLKTTLPHLQVIRALDTSFEVVTFIDQFKWVPGRSSLWQTRPNLNKVKPRTFEAGASPQFDPLVKNEPTTDKWTMGGLFHTSYVIGSI
jgi:hypothetical protein